MSLLLKSELYLFLKDYIVTSILSTLYSLTPAQNRFINYVFCKQVSKSSTRCILYKRIFKFFFFEEFWPLNITLEEKYLKYGDFFKYKQFNFNMSLGKHFSFSICSFVPEKF